ncbi:T9SS type A sorting domain-containing protein [Flavobacterium sp.]|uniref:T9SS type A sorting domain-containing protein n=1 Tax=Flavobacterium sp. TaxID=239 RepID=UPI0026116D39|nr:T9SS type A sorting domain-containing protein [Flavobacterium sp.]
MKKQLLLAAFALVSATASAQFTIWEETFNNSTVSDWSLQDLDGNGSNWISRKNIQMGGNGEVIDGTKSILGSYHINLTNGSPLSGDENNWAVSPVIDLSFYTGSIKLIINAQTAIYDGTRDLLVYVGTSADPMVLQTGTPTALSLVRTTNDGEFFHDYEVDLSQFAGQTEVHFALVMNALVSVGIEVDQVRITATDLLGVAEVSATKFALKQNPVGDNLEFVSGTNDMTNATVYVYNASGMLVKEARFSTDVIAVSHLPAGIYFAVVGNGNVTEKIKFIKK